MLYDVVVVGAGIAGSSTAYHLTNMLENDEKILLLEQFSVLHTKGNSHGKSRITRRAYDEPYYVHMMDECFRLWECLEKESGVKLYTKTGILVFGEDYLMQSTINSLEANGIAFEKFSGEEANKRWPSQLKLPSSYTCVLEEDGGILSPVEALAAYQSLFVKQGGTLWDNCPVTDIVPGEPVKVVTSKGDVFAKRVVITVGPWAQKWADKLDLQHIKFKSMRAEVFYWRAYTPEVFEASNFPVFALQKEPKHYIYGMPIFECPGVLKIANSLGPVIAIPEERDDNTTTKYRDEVSKFIEKHLKNISTEVDIYEACIVTYTPTGDPILDYHPKYKNIIIGLGLSGHGFKLSPVIGKVLSELALGKKPSYDLSPFNIDRASGQ